MGSFTSTLLNANPLSTGANKAVNQLYGRGLGADDTQTGSSSAALSLGNANAGRANDQYAWATAAGNHAIDMGNTVADRSLGLAGENAANATDAWNSYKTTFMPVQDKMVSDAMNYDSPDQMERVRQSAAGNANAAWDSAMADRSLGLQHMGVNPNSARFADPNATSLARTGAVAGSMNQATTDRQNTAIGLRKDVAGFGQNVAQLGNQNAGLAYTGLVNAAGAVDSATGIASAARTAPAAWSGAANNAYATAGGLSNQVYATQMGQINSRMASMDQFLGHLMPASGVSDENAKEEKLDIDEERVLDGLVKIPVKAWKYKDGIADSGRHVGPMAQDVHRHFGERAAPGGKRLDFLSMHGLALAGIQALAKKIDRLSAGLERVGA